MHLNISFLLFLFQLNHIISVGSSLKTPHIHEFSEDEEQHVIIYEGWLSKLEAGFFLKTESQERETCFCLVFHSEDLDQDFLSVPALWIIPVKL